MRRFNVFAPEFTYDDSRPEGYKAGSVRLSPVIGASRMVATVYELPPGESTWPYHYEYGAEEWALVLAGTPTLRHPEARTSSSRATSSASPTAPTERTSSPTAATRRRG